MEDGLRAAREALDLAILLRERLDHAHADDRLLGLRRDVGDALLHVAQDRERAPRVARRHPDHQRREHERGERERRARPDQEHDHGDHERDVLRDEDQAVAEEHADRGHVGRRPAQQLARLVVVVVVLLERQQVAVDAGAQVVLDVEREVAGEQAAPDHHDRLGGAERDDHADEHPQPRVVAGS